MTQSMTVTELLAPWLDISAENSLDFLVRKLELDSRLVSSGCTFVAVKGHVVDGRDFIDSAIRQGANAVIAETEELDSHGKIEWRGNIPIIYIANLNQNLSHIASRLMPLKHNRLIAVTGTNGKTTITQLIAQWLDLSGKKCAVLGTTGNGFLDALQPAANTTGHALEIQDVLSALEQQGAQYTAMEVSSHGLVQGRVKAQQFAVGIFSNLSRDHLDYHGSMEQYALAKRSLFTEHDCAQAVINIDDPIGASWTKEIKSCIPVSLSPIASGQGVYATSIKYASTGIELTFSGQFGEGCFTVPLVGEFNASNILLAFATLRSLGIEKNELLGSAGQLQSVLGRMELFQAESKAKVIVDYAHTPDALEKALLALKRHSNGKLWVIFGCGGDRDKGKRPMMAAIAESLADEVILTDDNPRSELPIEIVKDMLAGMTFPTKATVEHDRYQALAYALRHSCADDIILLAGKGHEDYQIVADKTLHYSDRESALQLLELTQ